jgi:hypothetical protein
MDNVDFVEIPSVNGGTEIHAVIDRGNGEFTSMLKLTYDEIQAKAKPPVSKAAAE